MNDELHIAGTRVEGCSAWEVARWHVGELPEEEGRRVASHVEACARCQAKLRAFEADRAAAPPLRIAGTAPRVPTVRRWSFAVAGLAMAAGFMLLIRPAVDDGARNGTKGAGELVVYVADAAGIVRVAHPGDRLGPADRVRIGLDQARRYVAVISIDDAGEVTPLLPESGTSVAVESLGDRLVPGSFEFTGAGSERIVAVYTEAPLPLARVLEAARSEWARAGSTARMGPLLPTADEAATVLLKP